MNIKTSYSIGTSIVALSGRFTFSDHAAFRDILTGQVEQITHGGKVTFDLSAVEFVDSAALGMLLLARETAQRHQASVILRGATGQVHRMLEISRFGMLFTIEP